MNRNTTREAGKRPNSNREREHAAMLEAALARPDVREAIQVIGGWQEKDRRIDAYRVAAKALARTATMIAPNSC